MWLGTLVHKSKCLNWLMYNWTNSHLYFPYHPSRETFYILGSCILLWEVFLENQKTLAGQAQKAVFPVMKLLNKFDNVTHDIYCDLFDKIIMPILCYGSEVWGFHKVEAIERVHLQFCKRILHLKYNTVNNSVYYELGRTNMQCVRYVRIVKKWSL